MGLTSGKTSYFLTRIEPYGFFILIGLLYLGLLDSFIGFFRGILIALIKALLP
jgi:hypothetical protein